jgi:predicted site-specific integrase-resolvase
MPNADAPKQVILYTRVSGEEQKKKGYSLDDQRDALGTWAAEEGYEVLEEVEDGAWSGGFLTRPGFDRVRELVAREPRGVHASPRSTAIASLGEYTRSSSPRS